MKKQEKKFVLAGLALLAITGLLALAGCKNDTVPEPTRYTVKFDKNAEDASGEMQSQIFTEGVEQELSANQFRRDTYTFSGWSEDKAATAPTYKDKAKFKATKDTTLYAVWTDNGTVDPVTFSLPDCTKFYFGESIAVSLETTTEGATIQYKLGNQNWQDYTADTTISITGDTTITAKATKEGLKPSTETTATYTVRKLEGITVTTLPARTVYSVGEEVVHKKDEEIEVTATYDEGEERAVTGTITTDTSTLTQSAGIGKKVTVSYTEGDTRKEATFTVDVASYQFTETVQDVDSSYTGTMTDGDYKKFGDWPQTIKDENVTVGKNTMTRGGMDFHVGSDGNYYVEAEEKANGSGTEYKYSNGDQAGQGGTSTKWFKVEPIVWRVLNKDYASTKKALLLAESILTGGIKWADSRNNYMQSYIRQWLNGNSGTGETSDYGGDAGFLQTAFTADAQSLIADTSVDNSAASTIPSGITDEDLELDWNSGENQYASDTPTKDKIFLLSQQEATNSEYGFGAYDDLDSARIRVTTDYAKATGAYQISTAGGWWWLRSPFHLRENLAPVIFDDGSAYNLGHDVYLASWGVVPALSISLGGN